MAPPLSTAQLKLLNTEFYVNKKLYLGVINCMPLKKTTWIKHHHAVK